MTKSSELISIQIHTSVMFKNFRNSLNELEYQYSVHHSLFITRTF